MIKLQGVSKTYSLAKENAVRAVTDISLEIHKGEFVIITGRSGSGKTTLLNLAAGLTRPTSGQVYIDDVEVWGLSDGEQSFLRNQKIGFVFQFPSLLPSLTTLQNVALPTVFGPAALQHGAEARARQLLEEVGLGDKLNVHPRQLSAGQQQRVVIARALMNQPETVLADEPTSNLDEQTEHEIMSLFRDIHRSKGITVLLVTHTRQLVPYGTRELRMANGRMLGASEVMDSGEEPAHVGEGGPH